MAAFVTHKSTAQGKAQTLQRRQLRTVKYANAASLPSLTRSGHASRKGVTA
jgi:hypothetical protein